MRKELVGGIASLLVALSPLTVMAQSGALDPETRATVIGAAQRVGQVVPSSPIAASASEETIGEIILPEVDEPAEDDPTENDVDVSSLPALDLTDLVEYSAQGVTFLAPADWIVDVDAGIDTPFTIEVPGTEVLLGMEADAALDFPSWLGVALFRSQAALLMGNAGDDTQIGEATTLYTTQNLPVAKLPFGGEQWGESFEGAMYIVAPNENAYMVVSGGTPEEWAYVSPGVDLLIESLTFDQELVNVVLVGDEPFDFVDEGEGLTVTVPAGWYVMSSGDAQFPVIIGEPEARYVAALGMSANFDSPLDTAELADLIAAEEISKEDAQDLIDDIVLMMEDSGSPILLDMEGSDVLSREGALGVRLVGGADIGDGVALPVIFYVDLRADDMAALAIFGNTEIALDEEEVIMNILKSIVGG